MADETKTQNNDEKNKAKAKSGGDAVALEWSWLRLSRSLRNSFASEGESTLAGEDMLLLKFSQNLLKMWEMGFFWSINYFPLVLYHHLLILLTFSNIFKRLKNLDFFTVWNKKQQKSFQRFLTQQLLMLKTI